MEKVKVAFFRGKKIRKTIHKNEWWFAIVAEYARLAGVTPPQLPPSIDLTVLESKILILIRSNVRISSSAIASRLNVGRDTIKEYTRKLKDKNKLKRHGSARNGYWEVT